MNAVKTQQFVMERRTFLRLSAAAALTGGLIDLDAVASQGQCQLNMNVYSAEVTGKMFSPVSGNELLYWIDGPMNDGLPGYNGGLETRARLSCTMVRPQNTSHFVQSVALVEVSGSLRSVVDIFFYRADQRSATGHAPYTVFENLDLLPAGSGKTWEIHYVVNQNGTILYFRHIISDPRPSRFDYSHLVNPAQCADAVLPDLVSEIKDTAKYTFQDTPGHSGFITTPFGTTMNHHCAARILKIEPVGSGEKEGDFEIEVDFMHGDASDTHYMRYFLVVDPVGRILGCVRRNYGDGVSGKVLVKRGFHAPLMNNASSGISAGIKEVYRDANGKGYGILHGARDQGSLKVPINLPNNEQLALYFKTVSILDCPHISIYTDDRLHAMARFTLRLR